MSNEIGGKMKIRIKYYHWLPRLFRVDAITLYPFVLFACGKQFLLKRLYKHEMIHIEQIKKVGVVWFYLSYLYYFIRYLKYHSIPWEIEAYARQTEELTDEEISCYYN